VKDPIPAVTALMVGLQVGRTYSARDLRVDHGIYSDRLQRAMAHGRIARVRSGMYRVLKLSEHPVLENEEGR
jgi:hypothetical protein